MKSDQTILEEAKEKLRKEFDASRLSIYTTESSSPVLRDFLWFWEKYKLQIQQIEQLKAELSQAKSALAASERFRAEDAMSAINEANHLREQLSQARERGG